jgi:hypothetical protein
MLRALMHWLFRVRLSSLERGYGLWGDRKVDGLEYQLRIRAEWSD